MKTLRWVYRLLLILGTVLYSACTITLGPLDESGGDEPRATSVLPAPEQPHGEEPALDEAQRARKEEVERYVAEVIYQGAPVVRTIQLPSGDIIDGLDRAWLPSLPYELPPLRWTPQDLELPQGVEPGFTDLEEYSELAELAATATPFQRPTFTFWSYILGETDATSIKDYLDRYQVGGQPASKDRLYAGLVSIEPSRGVSGYMNQFRPDVENGSFSLIEFAVACPAEGTAQEAVGVAISVDKANGFGKNGSALLDGEPRLHVEYARPVGGQVRYDWDGKDGRFVANPFRRYRPGQIVPVSAPGGTQVEHLIGIFQGPTGEWWITYRNELLGYYPANLFTMLNGGACTSNWYGEVYNPKVYDPDPSNRGPVKTEMGGGHFAETGLLAAAYVRNPKYYDLSWFGVEPEDDPRADMEPYRPQCYSRTQLEKDAAPWESVFLLGGPGGKDPGCQWP